MLVVPPAAERFAADKVVIACKNTREARRAVLDALPLLLEPPMIFRLCPT